MNCPNCDEILYCKQCEKKVETSSHDHFGGFSKFSRLIMPYTPKSFSWSDLDMMFYNEEKDAWYFFEFKINKSYVSFLQRNFFKFLSVLKAKNIKVYYCIIRMIHDSSFNESHEELGDPSLTKSVLYNEKKYTEHVRIFYNDKDEKEDFEILNLKEFIYFLCTLHNIEFPDLNQRLKDGKNWRGKRLTEDNILYIEKIEKIIDIEEVNKEKVKELIKNIEK